MAFNYRNDRVPILILLAITILNVGVIVGILLTYMPSVATAQILFLAAIEFVSVYLVYRYGKRSSMDISFSAA
jgi:hypothetical protein